MFKVVLQFLWHAKIGSARQVTRTQHVLRSLES
jgi:hypothetical protein